MTRNSKEQGQTTQSIFKSIDGKLVMPNSERKTERFPDLNKSIRADQGVVKDVFMKRMVDNNLDQTMNKFGNNPFSRNTAVGQSLQLTDLS